MQSQATQANLSVRPLVRLTDAEGRTDLAGLFIVRKNDPAKTIKDLTDYRILFGPVYDEERHAAALAALAKQGVTPVPPLQMVPSCTAAALAVVEGEADAAVISSYAAPLLDGCDGVDKEALRVHRPHIARAVHHCLCHGPSDAEPPSGESSMRCYLSPTIRNCSKP